MIKNTVLVFFLFFIYPIIAYAGYGAPSSTTWTSGSGVVYTTSNVAINQTTANTTLDVNGTVTANNYTATGGYYVGNNSLTSSLLDIDTTSVITGTFFNSSLADAGSVEMYFGKNITTNAGVLKYYKATDGASTSNYILLNHVGLATGGLYVRGSDGNVGVNKASPTVRFEVRESTVGNTAMRVQIDNTSIAGSVFIEFTGAAEAVLGGVLALNDTDVQYVTFCGAHYTITENYENIPLYSVLISTGEVLEDYPQCFKTRICSERKSNNAIGVYGGTTQNNLNTILCLGTGKIIVANKGENIEIGDYLMSSDIVGMAEKQDDDILHNYTIAKSSVNVVWRENEKSRIIACTYHGG